MKTIILCGGRGTRVGQNRAKPLLDIGDKPILWHIMKMYSHFGFRDFLLCLGHRGDEIREWVDGLDEREHGDWEVTCIDTGPETNSGGRLKKVEPHVPDRTFFANYADGLTNMDLGKLLAFHRTHGHAATLTAVRPRSQFGIVELDGAGRVRSFTEKPLLEQWANGGFFVFNRDVFDYLAQDDVLEIDSFERLVAANELHAFRFEGDWLCMDTYKDHLRLNELWASGQAFWKLWR